MDGAGQNSAEARNTLDEARSLSSLAENLSEINRVFKLGAAGERAMAVHRRMPELVRDAAQRMGALLEQALAGRQISEAELFDDTYRPLPGTRPQQYTTRFDTLTDRIFPSLQEAVLSAHEEIVYAIGTDRNAYVPTHNRCFAHAPTGDLAWDLAHCRSKADLRRPGGAQCGCTRCPSCSRPTGGIPGRSCTTYRPPFMWGPSLGRLPDRLPGLSHAGGWSGRASRLFGPRRYCFHVGTCSIGVAGGLRRRMSMSELLKNIDARTRLAGTNKLEILLFTLGTDPRTGRRETSGSTSSRCARSCARRRSPRRPRCLRRWRAWSACGACWCRWSTWPSMPG
jgi:hypothetical protein